MGRKRRKKNPFDSLIEFLEGLNEMSERIDQMGEIGVKLARIAGKPVITLPEGKDFDEYVVDMLDRMRDKWERLDSLFGKSRVRGDEAEIPIDGKIPAWMVYAPQLVERVMDNVEKRLEKMGLIEKGGEEVKNIPEFPKLEV